MDAMADKIKHEQLPVLIADDDPPTRILLRTGISQWGYTVIEAENGEEAWEILQKNPDIRLVILDWIMPKIDGLDVCRRINQELLNPPYIILLTQVTGSENIIKGLEAGADEFLSKPFNMAELRSRLSIGARIMYYKNELEFQNKQLKNYINNLSMIATMVSEISEKIDEADTLLSTLNDSEVGKQTTIRMNKIREHMQQLNQIIQQFQAQSKNQR